MSVPTSRLLRQIFPEFFDPGEEAVMFGLVFGMAAAGTVEFLEQLLLPLGQVHRDFDLGLDMHVAEIAPAYRALPRSSSNNSKIGR